LCKLDDIHAAVKKYYPEKGRDEDASDHYKSLLEKMPVSTRRGAGAPVQQIELLPMTAASALRVQGLAEGGSIRAWAEAALQDPALAAHILRKANGSAYGLPGGVDSIPAAAALLGTDGLAQAAREMPSPEPALALAVEQLAVRGQQCAR